MSKAAALEQRILRLLSDKDPDNRKHCIRMLRTFEYRHHVCMVFEPMVRRWGGGWVCVWVVMSCWGGWGRGQHWVGRRAGGMWLCCLGAHSLSLSHV